MECIVCYEITTTISLPCKHFICDKCVTTWWSRGNEHCPMCRQAICAHTDTEAMQTFIPDKNDIFIDFPQGTYPGITLKNSGRHVKITKLRKQDQCFKGGLKVGDTIKSINNLSCISGHKGMINIIDTACTHGLPILCKLEKYSFRETPFLSLKSFL